jgi:hypothetical protein
MSTPSENPLWQEHIGRFRRLSEPAPTPRETQRSATGGADAEQTRCGEWTAAPPGRLGRRLLADIEPYLEFFAIVRS